MTTGDNFQGLCSSGMELPAFDVNVRLVGRSREGNWAQGLSGEEVRLSSISSSRRCR